MKLPLIVRASPSIKEGPKVLVGAGNWKVTSNARDTEFYLLVDGIRIDSKSTVRVDSRVVVSTVIEKPGREKELNIWLEEV